MKQIAIYVHNNAYDEILLQNGGTIQVDENVMRSFICEPGDFNDWSGEGTWEGIDEELEGAASLVGEILAFHSEKGLIITDEEKFEERKRFFLGF